MTAPGPTSGLTPDPDALDPGAPVDLRCSVLIRRDSSVLLLRRDDDVWVLPGGHPHPGESLASCARREAAEECGLAVEVGRCQFVLEVADGESRRIDLVFTARQIDPRAEPSRTEPHLAPAYVALDELPRLRLRPPLAGHLRGLNPARDRGAAYLGNLWRPEEGS